MVQADPVVVGATLPLSGPLAAFGAAQRRGVQAVVDRANAGAGVRVGGEPRQVRLVVLDDRGDADVAGQRALVLVRGRDAAAALLGACAPPVTVVLVAEAREVPLVSGCGPLPLPARAVPPAHTWQLGPDDDAHAAAVATALVARGRGPVAVLGTAGRATAAHTAALAASGAEISGVWSRGPAGPQGTAGWREAVEAARTSGATRVLALTEPPDGLLLWQELARQGWRPDAAYVRDAGLTPGWPGLPAADGVLTDLHGSSPAEGAEAGAAAAAQALLDALGRAGSARRVDIGEALAGGPARLLGSSGGGSAPQLGSWQDGVLVAR